MLFIILCFININLIYAEEDSGETKFIDLLPEKEKKEFIESIARRIIEEVSTLHNDQNITSAEMSDDQLDKHSDYVKKLLEEEVQNLKKKSEARKNDNDGFLEAKEDKDETHSVIKREENVDLTLRNRQTTSAPNIQMTDKVIKLNDINAENIAIDIQILKNNLNETQDFNPDEVSVKVVYDDLITQNPVESVRDKEELSASSNVLENEKFRNEKEKSTARDNTKDEVDKKHPVDEILNVRAQTGLESLLNKEASSNNDEIDQSSSKSIVPDTKIIYITSKPEVGNDKLKNYTINARRLIELGTWVKPRASDLKNIEIITNVKEKERAQVESQVIPVINSIKNETELEINILKENSDNVNEKTDNNNDTKPQKSNNQITEKGSNVKTVPLLAESVTLKIEDTSYAKETNTKTEIKTEINSVQSKLEEKNKPVNDSVKSRRLLSSDDDSIDAVSESVTIKYENKPALRTNLGESNNEETRVSQSNITVLAQTDTESSVSKDIKEVDNTIETSTLDTTTLSTETSTFDIKSTKSDVNTDILSIKTTETDAEVTTSDIDGTASYTETSKANTGETKPTASTIMPTTSQTTFETVRIKSKHIESLETREMITTQRPVVTETQFFNWKDYNESKEIPDEDEKLRAVEEQIESKKLEGVTEKNKAPERELKLRATDDIKESKRVADVTERIDEFRTKYIIFNDTNFGRNKKESIYEDEEKLTEEPYEYRTKFIHFADKLNDNRKEHIFEDESKPVTDVYEYRTKNINFYEKFRGKKDESIFEDYVQTTEDKLKDIYVQKRSKIKTVRDDKYLFKSLSDDFKFDELNDGLVSYVTTAATPLLTTPTFEELTKNMKRVNTKNINKDKLRVLEDIPNIMELNSAGRPVQYDVLKQKPNIFELKPAGRPVQYNVIEHKPNIMELKPAGGQYNVYELLPGEDPFKKLNELKAEPKAELRGNLKQSQPKLKMKKIEPDSDISRIESQVDQPNYAPIYNYGPDNAYFNPQNKYGPNPNYQNIERESDNENELEKLDLKDLVAPKPKFNRPRKRTDKKNKKIVKKNRVLKPIDMDYYFGFDKHGREVLRAYRRPASSDSSSSDTTSSDTSSEEKSSIFPDSDDAEHPRNAMFYKVPPITQMEQAGKILHGLQYYGYKHLILATTPLPGSSTEESDSDDDDDDRHDTAQLNAHNHKQKELDTSELQEAQLIQSGKAGIKEDGHNKNNKKKQKEAASESSREVSKDHIDTEEASSDKATGEDDKDEESGDEESDDKTAEKPKDDPKMLRTNLENLLKINLGMPLTANKRKKRPQHNEIRENLIKNRPLIILTGENRENDVIRQVNKKKRRPEFDEDYYFLMQQEPRKPEKPKYKLIQRSGEESDENDLIKDPKASDMSSDEMDGLKKLDLKAVKAVLDNTRAHIYPVLKNLNKLYLPQIARSNKEFDNYVSVLKDMFENDSRALKQYDWLGTTVDIRSALKKMRVLTKTLKQGGNIPPKDLQLLKYVLYLYKSAKEDRTVFRRTFNAGKRLMLHKPIVKRPWLSTEGIGGQITGFLDFLDDTENVLNDLHNAIKHIGIITRYRSQRWYFNLKELYFKNPTRKQYLEILLHLTTSRLLSILEDAITKGLNENYVRYAVNYSPDVEKAKLEFGLIVRLVDELNRL